MNPIWIYAVTLVFLTPTGGFDHTKGYTEGFRSKAACVQHHEQLTELAFTREYLKLYPINKVITTWSFCHEVKDIYGNLILTGTAM